MKPALFLSLILLLFVLPPLAADTEVVAHPADTYVAPQFELFYTHNKMFRSHAVVSANFLTSDSEFKSAWAQYDIDFGFGTFFRRYLFKNLNAEKTKFVSVRLGYLQVSDLISSPNGFDEKRPLADLTLRLPVGRAWLLEDRSRFEYRIFDHDETGRYRNRVRVERNVLIKKFRMTPYGTGEWFFDGEEDRWNEFQGAFGVDLPWYYSTILELECMLQIVDGTHESTSYAIVVQKHL